MEGGVVFTKSRYNKTFHGKKRSNSLVRDLVDLRFWMLSQGLGPELLRAGVKLQTNVYVEVVREADGVGGEGCF